ncbi:hypothetical protein [Capillimicrobium parvum]|uniref:DUF3108 domain-containing protein n=1 Tax=Capillimicrobium parvum TaxID=2884022 RepID=A0A9E6XUN3_9ACTN|nr:hypothetical protein [Capillimicrobium parvum]UGS34779.1 hypothetical protein DSM104329_01161 [Capillimicrobium parvum]
MRRRPVVWLAATGAVLVAGLLGVRSWVLRDRTEPISVDRALDRFRGDRPARAPLRLPAGVRVPAAGVYEYATTGGERADLLGTSRHDYPRTTAMTVVPGGCGFTARWQALDLRSERWTFCAGPDALRPTRFEDVHSFYGRTDTRTYRCSGGALALTPRADRVTIVCVRDGTTRTDRVRAVGAERIRVGGEEVLAAHLRVATTMAGRTDGTGTVDLWLARGTGLPVRVRADVDNRSDTPIGRRVLYRERYELRLRSLRPRQ